MLRKPEFDVLYVDYAATEVVRANQFDPAINPAEIVEVDIVWGERPLVEAAGRRVDYVVASHVIEHVPDLIGWLLELHAVLKPGGVLGLAVPDKRFTFDALRKDTVLSEAVEAHLLAARQPSLRQVFEAASLGVAVDLGQVWRGEFSPEARRNEVFGRLPSALALARSLLLRPRYNDAHCWVFTPWSFLDLIEEFAVLGFFPFAIEAFYPSEPGTIEFQLRLTALHPGETDKTAASIRAAKETLANAAVPGIAVPEPLTPAPAVEPSPPGQDPERLAIENERLRAALRDIRQSTSWRLTAPVRALGRALKATPSGED